MAGKFSDSWNRKNWWQERIPNRRKRVQNWREHILRSGKWNSDKNSGVKKVRNRINCGIPWNSERISQPRPCRPCSRSHQPFGLAGLIVLIGLVGLFSFGLNGLIGKGIIVNSLQFKIEMKWSQHDYFRMRVGCGVWGEYFLLSLDSTQSSEMHYKMQHNYFSTGFRKWPNTASWGSVRISTHGYL